MKPNTAGLRFIASCIDQYPDNFLQSHWGESEYDADVAGSGVSCGTPCCIAGFAVQFLGSEEGYRKCTPNNKRLLPTGTYARHLLGLNPPWELALFFERWPNAWLTSKKIDPTDSSNVNSMMSWEDAFTPTPKDAAIILRRLADQFEEEFGVNEEAKKEVARIAEEVFVGS